MNQPDPTPVLPLGDEFDQTPDSITESSDNVQDDASKDNTIPPVRYEITSYGADIDAEGMVNRLKRDDVFIPDFQRVYVWSQREASRFIESLLLGLPVPGVFFAKAINSNRLLVIDGQQRLKTLQFYFSGEFLPLSTPTRKKVFQLQGVQERFEGRTYDTLEADDRIQLNDSIIHATIVKQDSPQKDQSSIYHIFERLNNSGRKLSAQQIRVAIYHGFVIDIIHSLNENTSWRKIFSQAVSKTLKDEELILRFFALYLYRDKYSRPMKDFLNSACEGIEEAGIEKARTYADAFSRTIEFIFSSIGSSAFKPERSLNAAVFDSVMVGTALRLENGGAPDPAAYLTAYKSLLSDQEYSALVSRATADDKNVSRRIEIAASAFSKI